MPSTRRVELEIAILEAKIGSFESQKGASVAEYTQGVSNDSDALDAWLKHLQSERDQVAVELAQKRLELFDLQGS